MARRPQGRRAVAIQADQKADDAPRTKPRRPVREPLLSGRRNRADVTIRDNNVSGHGPRFCLRAIYDLWRPLTHRDPNFTHAGSNPWAAGCGRLQTYFTNGSLYR